MFQDYLQRMETYSNRDAFADAVGTLPVPWKFESGDKQFAATINQWSFAEVAGGSVRFSPCQCIRGSGSDRAAHDYVCFTFQYEGAQRFVWKDQEVIAAPGDVVFWTAREPMMIENDVDAFSHNLWVPAHLAEVHIGDISPFIGQKSSVNSASGRMLTRHGQAIFEEFEKLPNNVRVRLINSLIGLAFDCVPMGIDRPIRRKALELLGQIKRKIINLDDISDISPHDIASEFGISVRYLQKIFFDEGITFSRFVSEVKLQRAHDALLHFKYNVENITKIAHEFGYFDASHFNRCFKNRYGITPSKYRKSR